MKKIPDYIPHSVSQDPKTNLWFYDLEGGEGGGCETREECERLMVEEYEQVYGPVIGGDETQNPVTGSNV